MRGLPRPDAARGFSLANVVFATYALFLTGFFFVPNAVDLYKFYIAAVFLPGLFLIRETLFLAWRSTIWRVLVAYLLFMLLSSLWSESLSGEVLWRDARYTAYIFGFVLLTLYFFSRDAVLPEIVLNATVIVAGIAAAVAVLVTEPLSILTDKPDYHWVGLGITDNPNPTAFVYGLIAVVALQRAVQSDNTRWRVGFAACFIAMLVLVVLTRSNTGLLALISASALLFLVNGKTAVATLAIGALLVGAGALYLGWSLGMLGGEFDIGLRERFPIWEHLLNRWREAPLIGTGLQQEFLLNAKGKPSPLNYAHSLFFATMRDGGLLGLILLLGVYGLALREGLRRALSGTGPLYFCMLCFGLLIVLVDVDNAITRPRELWIILWLPLACLIASELGIDDRPGGIHSPGKKSAS